MTREIWHSDDTVRVVNQPFDGAGQGGARGTGEIHTPDERITVGQALDAYTSGAAYAGFFDDRAGRLEVGKLADLAVLSQDIFTIPARDIGRTTVVMTLVGGQTVYAAGP